MNQDTMTLRDLSLRVRLGITPEERASPQEVRLSVEYPIDAKTVAATDTLDGAIDYASVCTVLGSLEAAQRSTLERLAEDAASLLLQKFPLTSVTVTVSKFPPLGTRSIDLRITRPR